MEREFLQTPQKLCQKARSQYPKMSAAHWVYQQVTKSHSLLRAVMCVW